MKIEKFVREYSIRSYECDKDGLLRIVALMNIFQDVADSHASVLGVGIEHCLQHGLAWVGSNYHIKISRMPSWHEKITVTTWPSAEKKIAAIRDFQVTDKGGNVIIVASSQWVLIDFAKKRPLSLQENLPFFEIIEQRALETDFPKIVIPETASLEYCFNVRYDDIDVNGHVNNAVYPLWATESIDIEWRLHNLPVELEIAFKKECLYGEKVTVITTTDGDYSMHSVVSGDDRHELARLRIKWKNK